MSKKQKQNVPAIYQGLERDPSKMRICVVIDEAGNISTLQTRTQLEQLKSYDELIKPAIESGATRVFDNFDKFLELNEQTILTYHDNMFGNTPPPNQDKITTASLTWYKLIANAKNNLVPAQLKDPITGKNSTKANRNYFLGEVKEGSADVKTYQALQCLKLFRAALGDRKSISEAELKQYTEDHVGELKTRQPAWRIFQYYRPTLIKAKLIKHD